MDPQLVRHPTSLQEALSKADVTCQLSPHSLYLAQLPACHCPVYWGMMPLQGRLRRLKRSTSNLRSFNVIPCRLGYCMTTLLSRDRTRRNARPSTAKTKRYPTAHPRVTTCTPCLLWAGHRDCARLLRMKTIG